MLKFDIGDSNVKFLGIIESEFNKEVSLKFRITYLGTTLYMYVKGSTSNGILVPERFDYSRNGDRFPDMVEPSFREICLHSLQCQKALEFVNVHMEGFFRPNIQDGSLMPIIREYYR